MSSRISGRLTGSGPKVSLAGSEPNEMKFGIGTGVSEVL
jgi:hypothetical protein